MKYAEIARTALALSLGMMMSTALADVVHTETFEGVSTTNYHPIVLKDSWKGGAEDNSRVVTNTYDPPAVGYPLPTAGHTKVLQLNTEGGTLTNSLDEAANFDEDNVYVDSMVKFVPSDALQTFDDGGIKVAVYAFIQDDSTTNLAVYHGFQDSVVGVVATNTVTETLVDASQWYRLTILLADGGTEKGTAPLKQGLQIYINGVPLTNDNAYVGEAWTDVTQAVLDAGLVGDGTWFGSAASADQKTISYLQFKGTGFVDDLVVGGGDPSFEQGEPPAGFQVTQNIGLNGSSSDPTSPIQVDGVSTTLTYTAAAFYEIASLTTNGVDVDGAAGAKAKTIDIYSATAVTSSFAIVSGLTADNVSWFQAKNWGEDDVVPGLDYDNLEMLNVAATNAAAAGGTITIEAIEVVGDDVKVTVFIDRAMSLGADIAGTLKLYGAAAIEDGFTEIGSVVIGDDLDGSQDDIRKVVTYAMAGGKKFYKAVIKPVD